ncbi:TPA: YjbQ family protein [archaeon]|uniref:YjbQ family protein n=1 Tax=Candidatus Naiadarchaeum limnaeum TaxID=2756139 RepID=A0A832UN18_9ARCH|nr:YjbQ family protein [Candidatus Naiadarchaeales archaeon SRR2090153.bin1042]HIK00209.1 YjbQ family protein [Candidatus Naiadarchaeum limnaeum]
MKISVSSRSRVDLIDVTGEVEKNLKIKEGIVVVYTPHTTCGLFINEYDSGLKKDIVKLLEKLVPQGAGWAHDPEEGNADSHMRSILLGHSVVVPVDNGKLQLGTWQSIFFAELFGPRTREVIIKEIKG